MTSWPVQRDYLRTHNLFYSAIFGEMSTGLVDIDYHIVGEFLKFKDRRNGATIKPSYTLFDGEFVIFFDILSPGGISEEDIDRISNYNKIGLEEVENHLQRTDISSEDLNPNGVKNFDHCIVSRESQLTNHETGDGRQRRVLERLSQEACVASVDPGSEVSLKYGQIHGDSINSLLQSGIQIPKKTGKNIYLPHDYALETLAVAICEELVIGSDLRNEGVALTHSDVRQKFGRDIPYDDIDTVFEYLRDKNACRKRNDDGKFVFTKYTLNQVMSVREDLLSESIEEALSNEENRDNRRLGDFDG